MSIRGWLGASLVANVALLGVIAFQNSTPDRPVDTASGVTATSPQLNPDPGKGLHPSERERMLALSTLEARARAANPPPLPEFWIPGAEARIDAYRLKVEKQQDEMRQALIAKYGAAAAEDPIFARLFRPLDARFAYLGSNAQLALAKLQRDRASAATKAGLPEAPRLTDAARVMDREREFSRAVRAALSDAEYDAYRLRESPAARQLRASGVVVSEREFRAVVETLEKMETDRTPGRYLEVQLSLKRTLGQERFVRFLASRDPAFQTVRSVALAQRVSESQVLAVYEAIVSAQLSVLDVQSKAGADRAQAATLTRDIISNRDARIASLVGAAPAQEILQAYSKNLMSANPRKDIAAL